MSLSQTKFAEIFGWTRAAISSYEEDRATPPESKLVDLAKYFSISIDQLLHTDLSEVVYSTRAKPLKVAQVNKESEGLPSIAKTKARAKVFDTLPLFDDFEPSYKQEERVDTSHHLIQDIDMVEASVPYEKLIHSHNDRRSFPKMKVPLYQKGSFKAFEGRDDAPHVGSWYIAKQIPNWFDIEDQKSYFIVSSKKGIFHRRVYNELQFKGELLMSGLKEGIPSNSLSFGDIDEAWLVVGELSFGSQVQSPKLGNFKRLIAQLSDELDRLK